MKIDPKQIRIQKENVNKSSIIGAGTYIEHVSKTKNQQPVSQLQHSQLQNQPQQRLCFKTPNTVLNQFNRIPQTCERNLVLGKVWQTPKMQQENVDEIVNKMQQIQQLQNYNIYNDITSQQFSYDQIYQNVLLYAKQQHRKPFVFLEPYMNKITLNSMFLIKQFFVCESANNYHPFMIEQAAILISFKQIITCNICDKSLDAQILSQIVQNTNLVLQRCDQEKTVADIINTEQKIMNKIQQTQIHFEDFEYFQFYLEKIMQHKSIDYSLEKLPKFRELIKSDKTSPNVSGFMSISAVEKSYFLSPRKKTKTPYSSGLVTETANLEFKQQKIEVDLSLLYSQDLCCSFDEDELLIIYEFLATMELLKEPKIAVAIALTSTVFMEDTTELIITFLSSIFILEDFGIQNQSYDDFEQEPSLSNLKKVIANNDELGKLEKTFDKLFLKQPGSVGNTLVQGKTTSKYMEDRDQYFYLKSKLKQQQVSQRVIVTKQEQIKFDSICLEWNTTGNLFEELE